MFARIKKLRTVMAHKAWWKRAKAAIGFGIMTIGLIASIITIAQCSNGATTIVAPNATISVQDGRNVSVQGVLYQHLLENPPDLSYSDSLYEQGREFFRQADYNNAILSYNAALSERAESKVVDLDSALIECALGLAYDRLGRMNEAIEQYTRAIGTINSISDDDVSASDGKTTSDGVYKITNEHVAGYARYLRGLSYFKIQNYERALDDCETCMANAAPSFLECGLYGTASVKNLFGRIAFTTCYDYSSPYSDGAAKDLGLSFDDAFEAYNEALIDKKHRILSEGSEESNEGVVVKGYFFGRAEYIYSLPGCEDTIRFGFFDMSLEDPDAETAAILSNRAVSEHFWGWDDEAYADLQAALRIYAMLPADQCFNMPNTYWYLTSFELDEMFQSGDLDKAAVTRCLSYMKQSLNYCETWLGACPQTAITLENVGFFTMIDDPGASISYYEQARGMFSDLGMDDDAIKMDKYIESAKVIMENDGEWLIRKPE